MFFRVEDTNSQRTIMNFALLTFCLAKEVSTVKDFLVLDRGMTEKDKGDKDLFNRQAILTGERVPIIFHDYIGDLKKETNRGLWNGAVNKMDGVVGETMDL